MFPIFQRVHRVDNQPLASSPSQPTEATERGSRGSSHVTDSSHVAGGSPCAVRNPSVQDILLSFAEHGLVFLYM